MLGFILSKLNLLILAVSMFSIIAFFTFGLGDLMKVNEANLLVDKLKAEAYSLTTSTSYCDSSVSRLPLSIKVIGEDLRYVINATEQRIDTDGDRNPDLNQLILSVSPRRHPEKTIAAVSVKTEAKIVIYSKLYTTTPPYNGEYKRVIGPDEIGFDPIVDRAIIDPVAGSNKMDGIIFVKEIRQGKATLYVIPFDTSQNIDEIKKDVGCKVHAPSNYPDCFSSDEGGFSC
jgi:hypothetical protein